jgi:hypothetical protein
MNKLTTLKWSIGGGVVAAFLGGCTSPGPLETATWNIPQAGSSWTVAQRNTGSYGKDTQFDVKRGKTVWQGQPAVTLTNSVTGNAIVARADNGSWMAIVDRDGKPVFTYDPPIGFQHPLTVGKEWVTTHRMTTVASGRTNEFQFSCKVEAYEPVTVRAGTFNSYKVHCKGLGYDDTYWASPDYGMFLKTKLRRFADYPQGAGTQEAELLALNLTR